MDAKQFVERVQAKVTALTTAAEADLAGATAEEVKAIQAKILEKAKGAVKAEEREQALKMVLDFAKAIGNDDTALMAAVALLTKSPRSPALPGAARVAQPRTNRLSILDQEFPVVGTAVHEDHMFAAYKYGRKETHYLIADGLKMAKDPETRKWISFEPANGMYTYEHQGAEPPAGWTGYVPRAFLKGIEAEANVATEQAASTDPVSPKPEF
jgi:hypothetical protein